ncbi:MAG: peptidyl-prolyl cis-trans isomerase [Thermodesulfobacteriota bacterium]|jgi:peptidyl-prolyl cis-trans isomerase SurA|nr:MAG: peptidyl-prolyl cis-trans isomerase [Thermodesulfobacteriota bacterium]
MFNLKKNRVNSHIFLLSIFLMMLSFSVRAEVVDEVVAVVNNEIITLSELLRVAQVQFSNADPSRYREILEKLVDQKLIDQATKDMSTKVSEKEIDEMIQGIKENNRITDDQLKDVLRQQGLTWEEYRNEIRQGIRRNQAISQMLQSQISVSEEEIKDYYQKHPGDFFEPAQVKLEQIFFPFPDQATPEKKKAISQSAEESLKKIKAGEDFQKVAQELNISGINTSCDVGTYNKGELLNMLDRDAFTLKPGEISNVINTDKGYCIIRVLERSEEKTRKIEDVHDAIANYLFQQKRGDKLQGWIQELRTNAYIDIKI